MNSRIQSLCKRVKKADKTAAGDLLTIFYPDVYAYLRRLCGSNQDAEDLTQQTFLKVWSSLDSFAGRSKFSTWLYRIAHNTYIDWRRDKGGQGLYRPDQWWQEREDENPGPSANVAERQLARRVYKAVDRLDEDKRHVVHLHYYQGLSIRETAKVLDIATSTVKYRLREVFKVLRTKIGIDQKKCKQEEILPITKGELI
jgi:RNA polymerase sigma-70 factor (ECF subfamily)